MLERQKSNCYFRQTKHTFMRIASTLFFALISVYVTAQNISNDFTYRHLTTSDGLSNSNVNCIAQDSYGFVWIGTNNGLNRYDGYTITSYFSDANDGCHLLSDEILALFTDSHNQIWVGTTLGCYIYNPALDDFQLIRVDTSNFINSTKPTNSIVEDYDGSIWIATAGYGVVHYWPETGVSKNYYAELGGRQTLLNQEIFSLYIDISGNLWIGMGGGDVRVKIRGSDKFISLNEYIGFDLDIQTDIIDIFQDALGTIYIGTRGNGLFTISADMRSWKQHQFSKKADNIASEHIHKIIEDHNGNIWITTSNSGILLSSDNLKTFTSVNENQLLNNNIRCIFEDRQGNIWSSSFHAGINLFINQKPLFSTYPQINSQGSEGNTVTSIAGDAQGNFWIGTDGGGLKFISNDKTHFAEFTNNQTSRVRINDAVVMSVLVDSHNNLWIGTFKDGLIKVNLQTYVHTHFKADGNPKSIQDNYVMSITEDRSGNIWIGTNGHGIGRYDGETNTFINYQYSPNVPDNQLVNNWINDVFCDYDNNIWVATTWGVSKLDTQRQLFTNYMHIDSIANSLSSNITTCITQTHDGIILIGTRTGLNVLQPDGTFKIITTANGLPGNMISSIEEDDRGELWISTNRGICCLSLLTGDTYIYTIDDGLSGNEFFRNASFKSADGEMFFGSTNGLNSFYPDNVGVKLPAVQPLITEFSIFNKPLRAGQEHNGKILLNKPIWDTDTITLNYSDNSFSFEFSCVDFISAENTIYQYMMEGFDNEWITANARQRVVTYTNLKYGNYIFKVRASNSGRDWTDNAKSIYLIIKPPFYRTWWAYLIYYIAMVLILIFSWITTFRRIHIKNELHIAQLQKDQTEALTQSKLQFFTNISHEFRTPITLIVGPLEKMLATGQLNGHQQQTLSVVLKNAHRLLQLVNQIMDLRKVENNKMQLHVEHSNLGKFLANITDSFNDYAVSKGIKLNFENRTTDSTTWFDADKIDKVMFNLLSNAFKFTPQYGNIDVVLSRTLDKFEITVADTGKGIPAADLDRIFERFYQVEGSANLQRTGTGVGLALAKGLVESHHGTISVMSELGKGTIFTILIPADELAYTEAERANNQNETQIQPKTEPLKPIVENDTIQTEVTEDDLDPDKKTVLIVEDNYDLRQYIKSELEPEYNIVEAANGREGLHKSLQLLPDVVVSDVMMPEMDGLQMCQELKQNIVTNHIPVILLTARSSIEHRIEGLEHGADSYIPKPFNTEHLQVRIRKLIEIREILYRKYSNSLSNADGEVSEIQIDDPFLRKVSDYIYKNIDNAELSIETMSQDLCISRGHLHKKLKMMVNMSPSEYLRVIRLNEAVKLFAKKQYNISEVAYMVGFNSPSYFTNCFKTHFGISPTEYVDKMNKS